VRAVAAAIVIAIAVAGCGGDDLDVPADAPMPTIGDAEPVRPPTVRERYLRSGEAACGRLGTDLAEIEESRRAGNLGPVAQQARTQRAVRRFGRRIAKVRAPSSLRAARDAVVDASNDAPPVFTTVEQAEAYFRSLVRTFERARLTACSETLEQGIEAVREQAGGG
jgi:hypothetical protein